MKWHCKHIETEHFIGASHNGMRITGYTIVGSGGTNGSGAEIRTADPNY